MDRETFLKQRTREFIDFPIEGLGHCRMRKLTESERVNGWDLWLRPNGKTNDSRAKDSRLKTIVLCLVGDDGEPILKDSDIPSLRELPACQVSQLVEVAWKCMGMSEDDMMDKIKKKSDSSSGADEDTLQSSSQNGQAIPISTA